MRIGLTGGIGSGKSTVALQLARLGALVVDADAISRASTGPNGGAVDAIRSSFGSDMVNAQGALDRAAMRQLIFAYPSAKKTLEDIIHPIVRKEVLRQTEAAESQFAPCVVLDIPLLVECPHWQRLVHQVVVVDCTEATQISRVITRSALSSSEIQSVIASQTSRIQRLRAADWVIYNDGITLEQLEITTREIAPRFGL